MQESAKRRLCARTAACASEPLRPRLSSHGRAAAVISPQTDCARAATERLPHSAYPRRAVGRRRAALDRAPRALRAGSRLDERRPPRAPLSATGERRRRNRRGPSGSGPGRVSPRPVFLAAGTALESSPASRRRRYRKPHVVRNVHKIIRLSLNRRQRPIPLPVDGRARDHF